MVWRLVDEPRTNPLEIKGIDDVDSALAEVLMQLQQAAPDFLRGDVRRFRAARVEQNKHREPYTIWAPDDAGKYVSRPDPASIVLKERYSKP